MERIAFIICYTDESKLQECLYYINRQIVPNNIKTEVIPIQGAESMAEGYAFACEQTKAKIKVYLSENTLLVRSDFVITLLEVFEDESVGMLGVVGSTDKLINASYAVNWNVASLFHYNAHKLYSRNIGLDKGIEKGSYTMIEVEALDGMLLATQYDCDWDTVSGYEQGFYDVAYCEEMKAAGHKLMAIGSNRPFILSDSGVDSPVSFDSDRKKFCEKYASLGYVYGEDMVEGYEAYDEMVSKKTSFLNREKDLRQQAIDDNMPTQAGAVLKEVEDLMHLGVPDTDLNYYLAMIDVYAEDLAEMGYSNMWPAADLDEAMQLYMNIKYLLWRAYFGCPEEDWEALASGVEQGIISEAGMNVISKKCTGNKLF